MRGPPPSIEPHRRCPPAIATPQASGGTKARCFIPATRPEAGLQVSPGVNRHLPCQPPTCTASPPLTFPLHTTVASPLPRPALPSPATSLSNHLPIA
ncbi:hypothetical protein NL676_023835 [Syzygium grande]|nr:hypothetical protein NL676_023835 [Syzygium grande]